MLRCISENWIIDSFFLDDSPNGFDGNGIPFKAKLIGMKRN
jgi:hypothetical protein